MIKQPRTQGLISAHRHEPGGCGGERRYDPECEVNDYGTDRYDDDDNDNDNDDDNDNGDNDNNNRASSRSRKTI